MANKFIWIKNISILSNKDFIFLYNEFIFERRCQSLKEMTGVGESHKSISKPQDWHFPVVF